MASPPVRGGQRGVAKVKGHGRKVAARSQQREHNKVPLVGTGAKVVGNRRSKLAKKWKIPFISRLHAVDVYIYYLFSVVATQ